MEGRLLILFLFILKSETEMISAEVSNISPIISCDCLRSVIWPFFNRTRTRFFFQIRLSALDVSHDSVRNCWQHVCLCARVVCLWNRKCKKKGRKMWKVHYHIHLFSAVIRPWPAPIRDFNNIVVVLEVMMPRGRLLNIKESHVYSWHNANKHKKTFQ